MRIAMLSLLLLAIEPASAAPALDAAALQQAAASPCGQHSYAKRGRAPRGFVKGMALGYATAWCELRRDPAGPVARLAGTDFNAGSDALAHYGRAGGSAEQRLRALFALALGEGMRESSGNPSEGPDATVQHQTAQIAEAGLFQVSHDSLAFSPRLAELWQSWKQRPAADCALPVFMEGVKDRQRVVGEGAGAEFQQFTKACPMFAVDYAALMFRVKLQHFGPIKRREAELVAACEAMFAQVEATASCP